MQEKGNNFTINISTKMIWILLIWSIILPFFSAAMQSKRKNNTPLYSYKLVLGNCVVL